MNQILRFSYLTSMKIYMEKMFLFTVKFIRPELKFNSEKELILQMKSDSKTIENILADD